MQTDPRSRPCRGAGRYKVRERANRTIAIGSLRRPGRSTSQQSLCSYHCDVARLDYRTAGESHGAAVIALIEGLPAGLRVDTARINEGLRLRQGGFGRGGRQRIERDEAAFLSGLLRGETIGAPVTITIANRDHRIDEAPPLSRPRPGHADFAGAMKWRTTDCRPILERASARETAARVLAGGLARQLIEPFGIETVGWVRRIGGAGVGEDYDVSALAPAELAARRAASDVYCPDESASAAMIQAIQAAKRDKDTVGGIVEVRVTGCPPGLGSCMRWQDKLDARLMGAVGSIQAIKAVAIGAGFDAGERRGSAMHDALEFDAARAGDASAGFVRRGNNAGGLEGGMTNGMPMVVRAAMKPISTLLQGIDTVDLSTREAARSDYERSDICAVPAAAIVAEHVVAFEIARALLEKFGGDTLNDVRAAYERYLSDIQRSPGG